MSALTVIKNQPVAFAGSVATFGAAMYTVATAFEWIDWSQEQQVAVGGAVTALTALLTFLVRGLVTPVSNPKITSVEPLVPASQIPAAVSSEQVVSFTAQSHDVPLQ